MCIFSPTKSYGRSSPPIFKLLVFLSIFFPNCYVLKLLITYSLHYSFMVHIVHGLSEKINAHVLVYKNCLFKNIWYTGRDFTSLNCYAAHPVNPLHVHVGKMYIL